MSDFLGLRALSPLGPAGQATGLVIAHQDRLAGKVGPEAPLRGIGL
ncbi:MAG: hypothetical protein ACT4OP_13335 [Actinomycetota bacterium]